jgi:4-amino-4-deoxy-L-arabinose transferase-like glycosyltransferase
MAVRARTARRPRALPAGARSRRPPAALVALLLLTAIVGVAWALVTPAFQAPDENSHFGYVQTLAERFALPGQAGRPPLSREQIIAGSLSNSDQAAQQLQARMEWSRSAYDRWRAQAALLSHDARTDGGGGNPASSNPPLYYLYEAIPYRLAEGGDLFTRLTVTRLASVLWMLLTVAGVWLLAGEVFARERLAQLAAAGTAGLLPMVGFVSASLNPDAMLYAEWSVALWLGVRLLRRGPSLGGAAALFAVVGLACMTKATSYALIPAALFALAVALRRFHGRRVTGWLPAAVAAGAALVLTLGVWFVVARAAGRPAAAQVADATGAASFNLREFLSYVWQFYLPHLSFQTPFDQIPGSHLPVYDIWLTTGWAAFGWLEVRFPGWVYVVLMVVTAGVAGLALAGLWRARRRVDLAVVGFLALGAVMLVAGLHWTEYHMLISHQGPFNNGRYLLPLVGIAGLAVAGAVRWLRPAARATGVAAALAALLVLNVLSLGLCLERFYA